MLQVNSATTAVLAGTTPPPASPMREATRDLAVALRNNDLAGAREAFVAVVKAAPDTAQWDPDSSVAAVGRALLKGDLPAAQEAAKAGLVALREQGRPETPEPRPAPGPQPGPQPGPSSTGGLAGSTISLVA